MYMSAKEKDFKKKVSTDPDYIVFHIRVYDHLTSCHSVIETYNNIKKLLDFLDNVIIETTRHNLKQVIYSMPLTKNLASIVIVLNTLIINTKNKPHINNK
jgi:hypothetical protein